MAGEVKAAALAMLALTVLVLGTGWVLVAENRRMKQVLIEQTLVRLEREYEEARRAEDENLGQLKSSLADAFDGLTALRGLSGEETELVQRAMTLTDAILRATTSGGISGE